VVRFEAAHAGGTADGEESLDFEQHGGPLAQIRLVCVVTGMDQFGLLLLTSRTIDRVWAWEYLLCLHSILS
jgi:hypothetical protein